MNDEITDLEKKTGWVAPNTADLPDTTDHQEFANHAIKNNFTPVAYDDRVKFLQDNGYEVNRENMVNPQLSARQQPELNSEQPPAPPSNISVL